MRPLRIASLNAYLICDVFNNYRQTHPEKRASKIRSAFLGPSASSSSSSPELALALASTLASSDESVANKTIHAKTGRTASRLAPDLCFFQEVWGSGIRELTRGIEHSIPPRRSSSRLASGFLWLAKSCSSNDSGNGNGNGNGNGKSSNARWGAAASLSLWFSRLGELVDTLRFHWQRTGGLYDASRPSLSCLYRRKHTFGVSRSRSHKGVEATLWDVPQWNERPEGSDNATGSTAECTSTSASTSASASTSTSTSHRRQLLVFNTHLDPWHPSNRKQQIAEIAGFMEETLRSIEDGAVTGDSCSVNDRRSPSLLSSWCFELLFPCTNQGGDPQQRSGYDWSQTAVLVVGDFNIKAGSDEYRGMFSRRARENPCRDWIDCFASDGESDDGDGDHHHHHPEKHTYAVRNSLVEYPEDCGRIDYILGIPSLVDDDDDDDRNDGEDDDRTTQNGVDCDCARRSRSGGERQGPPRSRVFLPLTVVSRWIRTEPIGEESSDHYALIVELIPSA